MGELVLIDKCRHCEDGTIFYLWRVDGQGATDYDVHDLIASGRLSPAALVMPERDIVVQFNNVNGGEEWLTLEDEPRPWIARRTEANSDGTEPALWAFFVNNEAEARMWLDAGQVDTIEGAP